MSEDIKGILTGQSKEVFYDGMWLLNCWGNASPIDVAFVLASSKKAFLWNSQLHLPAIQVYHGAPHPLMHSALQNGIAIVRLTTKELVWDQYAYQFAHELCHVVTQHTHMGKRFGWTKNTEQSWLEESFCEAASFLTLKRLSKIWEVLPPWPHWISYAPQFQNYLTITINDYGAQPNNFLTWFTDNESSLREDALQRNKNAVIALKLLPLMECNPHSIGALSHFSGIEKKPEQSLLSFSSRVVRIKYTIRTTIYFTSCPPVRPLSLANFHNNRLVVKSPYSAIHY